jgi:hypothetical protein
MLEKPTSPTTQVAIDEYHTTPWHLQVHLFSMNIFTCKLQIVEETSLDPIAWVL